MTITAIESQVEIILEDLSRGEEGKLQRHLVVHLIGDFLDEIFQSPPVHDITPFRRGNMIEEEVGEPPPLLGDQIESPKEAISLRKEKEVLGWKRGIMRKLCGRERGVEEKEGTMRMSENIMKVWKRKRWKEILRFPNEFT